MYAIFFPTAMRNMANADSGNQSNQVRILVADDHEVMRLGIRNLLESVPNWTVIDEAGTGREAVDLRVAKARLDVLRRRARETVAGAVVLALAGAVFAASGHSQLAFSFAFGAALGFAIAYLAGAERSHLLTRLVAQGDAGLLAEAEAFARKLSAPGMRLRLARGLERIGRVASRGRPPRRRAALRGRRRPRRGAR